eukprot:TRINITY_DN3406_c0_g1_i2.p1 TRINITY_DN3406_c0_g1~~TRINITY_DN3406_c0_g1_i2.p1  ORF type:complete len:388 (-),score=119.12 TRINITY_DN3406_c0_g1_i2:63-1226(-)
MTTLTLLRRNRTSTIPLPASRVTSDKQREYLGPNDKDWRFARFCVTDNIRDILDREAKELSEALLEARSSQEDDRANFLVHAQKELERREEEWYFHHPPPPASTTTTTHKTEEEPYLKGEKPLEDTDEKEPLFDDWVEGGEPVPQLTLNTVPNQESPIQTDEESPAFFFYQEASGQLYFLHQLNFRCLMEEYGSYEHLPQTIQARILEVEEMILTQEATRRYRYLQHLPLGCGLKFCEIEMKGLVSRRTLAPFLSQLDRRQHRRTTRQRLDAQLDSQSQQMLDLYKANLSSSSDPVFYSEFYEDYYDPPLPSLSSSSSSRSPVPTPAPETKLPKPSVSFRDALVQTQQQQAPPLTPDSVVSNGAPLNKGKKKKMTVLSLSGSIPRFS